MREILPDIWTWPAFSEEKGFNFNGHYVITDAGAFLIDPVAPNDEVWRIIESRMIPEAIYLTNKDHTRKSLEFKARYDCPIWIHEADQELADIPIDETFQDDEELAGGFRVIRVADLKSPGESAFLLQRDTNVLFLGDCLIGNPPGTLNLLPPAKIPDQAKATAAIRELLTLNFDAVLVGDGVSFPEGGRRAIEAFIRSTLS